MIFPSNIIAVFSSHNGIQSPDDSNLIVPNVLQPVIELPAPILQTQEVITSSNLQAQSFARDASATVANGAIVDQAAFALAPGLWDIHLYIRAVSNYTNLGRQSFVYMALNGSAGAAFIFVAQAITNVVERQQMDFRLSIQNPQGLTFLYQIAANGVGESSRLDLAALCNRLG